jgi:hypothetical protein
MHLEVFLKLKKKTLKTLSSGQIYKKNQKTPPPQKKTLWAGFFFKPGFFPPLQQVALEILANLCTGDAEDSWEEEDNSNISDNEDDVEEGGVENGVEVSVADPEAHV